jgi:hypothetical protein
MGESKNFKMLEFPLNQLQTYYGYLCDLCPFTAFIFSDLNHKLVIFLSQTESTPKHLKENTASLSRDDMERILFSDRFPSTHSALSELLAMKGGGDIIV